MLTVDNINRAILNEEWAGAGYLAARKEALHHGRGTEVSVSDQLVLEAANAAGMDDGQLFEWLNSKPGRWFADAMLSPAAADRNRVEAERYLPGVIEL